MKNIVRLKAEILHTYLTAKEGKISGSTNKR